MHFGGVSERLLRGQGVWSVSVELCSQGLVDGGRVLPLFAYPAIVR